MQCMVGGIGGNLLIPFYLLTAVVVSCYFFPFELTLLPKGLNTKMILAGYGIILLGLVCIKTREVKIDKELLPAIVFTLVFSLLGFIAMDINNSNDTTYAFYFISFATWLLAGYTVYRTIKAVHGYANFRLLVNYLIVICVAQCFIAVVIDFVPVIKQWVDLYIGQDTVASVEFLNKVDRLYGIGAALDVAGTRFSIVLIGLVALILQEAKEPTNNWMITYYWIAFLIIAVIGNMISRTTSVGMGLASIYLLFGSKVIGVVISNRNVILWTRIFLITICFSFIGAYFYSINKDIKGLLRFGFEGFFNWVERGEWRTDSTDRLNSVMWIWPDNLQTWIIGKADFSWEGTLTDIGYCRFIFYNGLLGLITFSLFFIYNAWACSLKFPANKLFFVLIMLLGFIIWLKIPTDMFIIYALLYCLDREEITTS